MHHLFQNYCSPFIVLPRDLYLLLMEIILFPYSAQHNQWYYNNNKRQPTTHQLIIIHHQFSCSNSILYELFVFLLSLIHLTWHVHTFSIINTILVFTFSSSIEQPFLTHKILQCVAPSNSYFTWGEGWDKSAPYLPPTKVQFLLN